MKKYLTLIFLLPAVWTFSQTTSKHSLALVISPDVAYTREVNQNTSVGKQAPSLGYRVRLDYYRRLCSRVAIKTGLGYAEMNLLQKIAGSNLQWPSQNNGNGGYDPSLPGENTDVRLRQSFHFLQIPLGFKIDLTAGPLQWIAELEGGLMLRLGSPDQQRTQPYAAIATGLEVHGKAGWTFSAQPALRYHLRSNYPAIIGGTVENRSYLYSMGLEVAIRRAF